MPAAKKSNAGLNEGAMLLDAGGAPVYRTCGSDMSDGAHTPHSNTHAASIEPFGSPSAHA